MLFRGATDKNAQAFCIKLRLRKSATVQLQRGRRHPRTNNAAAKDTNTPCTRNEKRLRCQPVAQVGKWFRQTAELKNRRGGTDASSTSTPAARHLVSFCLEYLCLFFLLHSKYCISWMHLACGSLPGTGLSSCPDTQLRRRISSL